MTDLESRVRHIVHFWVKPFTRALISSVYRCFAELIREKDKKGWNVELVQQFRRVFKRWELRKVDYGSKEVKIFRPYLRQLFDLICLMAEVEPHKTEQAWEFLKEELRKERLI